MKYLIILTLVGCIHHKTKTHESVCFKACSNFDRSCRKTPNFYTNFCIKKPIDKKKDV